MQRESNLEVEHPSNFVVVDDPDKKQIEEKEEVQVEPINSSQLMQLRLLWIKNQLMFKNDLNYKTLKSLESITKPEYDEIMAYVTTVLYQKNNDTIVLSAFNAFNAIMSKVFGVEQNELNEDLELRAAIVNSPASNYLAYIPPIFQAPLRYVFKILQLKNSQKDIVQQNDNPTTTNTNTEQ